MTISEIAKLAGVSSAAVSRYLNGGSEVFTCRFYGMEEAFLFEGKAEGTMNLYQMHGFSMKDTEEKDCA